MPKAKGKTRRQKFGYNVNRKRLNRNARRKAAPRIECSHIRHAWDQTKSVRQNLADMDLEAEASLPEKKGNTLSRDLIDYVCYMVENHGEDYKIRNKINVYKRFYPAEWQAFVDSLQKNKMEVE
eukprot:bmy_08402T0